MNPLVSQGRALSIDFSLHCGSPHWGWRGSLCHGCVSAFSSCLDVVLFLFAQYKGVALLVFWDPPAPTEEIVPYVAIDSVFPWEETSSGSFYVIILNWSQRQSF